MTLHYIRWATASARSPLTHTHPCTRSETITFSNLNAKIISCFFGCYCCCCWLGHRRFYPYWISHCVSFVDGKTTILFIALRVFGLIAISVERSEALISINLPGHQIYWFLTRNYLLARWFLVAMRKPSKAMADASYRTILMPERMLTVHAEEKEAKQRRKDSLQELLLPIFAFNGTSWCAAGFASHWYARVQMKVFVGAWKMRRERIERIHFNRITCGHYYCYRTIFWTVWNGSTNGLSNGAPGVEIEKKINL